MAVIARHSMTLRACRRVFRVYVIKQQRIISTQWAICFVTMVAAASDGRHGSQFCQCPVGSTSVAKSGSQEKMILSFVPDRISPRAKAPSRKEKSVELCGYRTDQSRYNMFLSGGA